MENAILIKGSSVIKHFGHSNYNKMRNYLITVSYKDRVYFDTNDIVNLFGRSFFEKNFKENDLVKFPLQIIDKEGCTITLTYN
jgi:hypothetical protein